MVVIAKWLPLQNGCQCKVVLIAANSFRDDLALTLVWCNKEQDIRGLPLVTTTASNHHVVILLQDDVLVVVKVEQADGVELVGHTARRVHVFHHTQGVDDALHRGVVGRLLALAQWEGALALALIGVVAVGGDDPARPADLLKVNKHLVPGARPSVPEHVECSLLPSVIFRFRASSGSVSVSGLFVQFTNAFSESSV